MGWKTSDVKYRSDEQNDVQRQQPLEHLLIPVFFPGKFWHLVPGQGTPPEGLAETSFWAQHLQQQISYFLLQIPTQETEDVA